MILFEVLGIAETLVKYEPGKGYLHTMNPLSKLALVISVFGLGIFAAAPGVPWFWGLSLFLVTCLITSTGGVHLYQEFKDRKPYIIFIVLIFGVMNLFTGRGYEAENILFHIPPWFTVTDVSVQFAVTKTLFLLTSIVVFTLLLKSTHLSDLTYSISKVGMPYAVAMITATSVRCVPMVTNSLKVTYNAQRARGLDLDKGNIKERIKHMGSLMAPLILVLIKTIDLMAIVFHSRGLDLSNKRRTHIREMKLSAVDLLTIFISLGGLITLIILTATGIIEWQFAG
ncbi:MAG: energy-coupling factor transporter transmembrane protein EcfT [Halanaerobiales bacterium]|nr:energy-coupling factor transporter transmembrane protein EcfT [Halanaerobiales bacterium]